MASKAKTTRGSNGLYGVQVNGAVLYEPMFPNSVAKRICQLENGKNPPEDWFATEEILEKEGLLKKEMDS